VNALYTELMSAVESLSVDKDRDVQYIMSTHLDPESLPHWSVTYWQG